MFKRGRMSVFSAAITPHCTTHLCISKGAGLPATGTAEHAPGRPCVRVERQKTDVTVGVTKPTDLQAPRHIGNPRVRLGVRVGVHSRSWYLSMQRKSESLTPSNVLNVPPIDHLGVSRQHTAWPHLATSVAFKRNVSCFIWAPTSAARKEVY